MLETPGNGSLSGLTPSSVMYNNPTVRNLCPSEAQSVQMTRHYLTLKNERNLELKKWTARDEKPSKPSIVQQGETEG